MSILQVTDLTQAYGEKTLYQKASFSLYKGEHLGIVGQNGTGKSTLLNILLSTIVPSDGEILWQIGLSIGHIDQHSQVEGGQTIKDYLQTAFSELYEMDSRLQTIYRSMNERTSQKEMEKAARYQETLEDRGFYTIDSEIAKVATGLGLAAIGLDRHLSTLSGGQRTKAILAKLLLRRPDVLLLDEPTNFLDKEHIAWLTEYLRGFEGSFMIVSHDFAFLEDITNCILDIEFQTIRKYHGKYSDFLRQKTQQRADYIRQYDAQQREMARLSDYIAKNKVRAATAQLAKSRQKALDRMEKLPPPSVLPAPHIAFRGTPLTLRHALTVQNLKVGYDAPLLPGLSFSIDGGQKVVISGFNGIGKSTLLKTLMGILPALGGRYEFAPPVKALYFEQDLRWPSPSQTPLEIISAAYPNLSQKEVRRALARCGLIAKHAIQPIASLSGGEQNKVKLCRLTLTSCNFLILDEPTNHLDAETKTSLREAIENFPGSVILVCHEAAFYKDMTDKVINIEKYVR